MKVCEKRWGGCEKRWVGVRRGGAEGGLVGVRNMDMGEMRVVEGRGERRIKKRGKGPCEERGES
jgi:hypothetical protein